MLELIVEFLAVSETNGNIARCYPRLATTPRYDPCLRHTTIGLLEFV